PAPPEPVWPVGMEKWVTDERTMDGYSYTYFGKGSLTTCRFFHSTITPAQADHMIAWLKAGPKLEAAMLAWADRRRDWRRELMANDEEALLDLITEYQNAREARHADE